MNEIEKLRAVRNKIEKEFKFYDSELGIDGTINELIDWAYRYSDDYTDEALDFIRDRAKELGLPDEKWMIPELVKKDRGRASNQLPYEQIKLDKLVYGKINYSSTEDYGEVEIFDENEKVIVSITGINENGCFTACNMFDIDEFMHGEDNFLEVAVGETMMYGTVYEED